MDRALKALVRAELFLPPFRGEPQEVPERVAVPAGAAEEVAARAVGRSFPPGAIIPGIVAVGALGAALRIGGGAGPRPPPRMGGFGGLFVNMTGRFMQARIRRKRDPTVYGGGREGGIID